MYQELGVITLNLLLIDDHELFAYSLVIALKKFSEIRQIHHVNNPEDLFNELIHREVDIVLMDIQIGNIDGIEIGKQLKKRYPLLPLVFVTGFDLPEYRYLAHTVNADGFVSKSISPHELVHYLLEVKKGYNMTEGFQKPILSKREKEILKLVSEGMTQESIAIDLGISKRTVNNHVGHIISKLDTTSSIEAVSKAIALGIIPIFRKYDKKI